MKYITQVLFILTHPNTQKKRKTNKKSKKTCKGSHIKNINEHRTWRSDAYTKAQANTVALHTNINKYYWLCVSWIYILLYT